MDKRLKPLSITGEIDRRDTFFRRVRSGEMSISEAVREMRKLSKLTQPEFAKHRGISVDSLRAIERGAANPTVETLNKVASIFGLEVGFVARRKDVSAVRPARSPSASARPKDRVPTPTQNQPSTTE